MVTDELLERIATALERIADTLEQTEPDEQETDAEPTGCQHPDEQRVSLASAGNLNRFYCKACEEYVN